MLGRAWNLLSVWRATIAPACAEATGTGEGESAPGSIEGWRERATDVYCAAIAAIHLPAVMAATLSSAVDRREAVVAWGGWLLTFAAAVLRRLPTSVRVWLLVVAVWMYAITTLLHGGIFANFRVVLIGTPLAVLILAGARQGLIVGAINLAFIGVALNATAGGWLRQSPAVWGPGEWGVQFVTTLGVAVPQILLLAWFGHHFAASIRRERATACRLEREAQRREQLEREVLAAAERESQRIGGELHDGVCQDLAALLLRTKRTQRMLEAAARPEAEALRGICEGIGEAIGDTHAIAKRLSPGRLSGQELGEAIEDLARRTADVVEAEVVLQKTGTGVMSPSVTLHLYRIAQESIANAARHAAATRIDVLLEHGPEGTLLRVEDDGRGLSPEATASKGLGLKTMEWRAAKCGATLRIVTRPGGGTRVECQVPPQAGEENSHGV